MIKALAVLILSCVVSGWVMLSIVLIEWLAQFDTVVFVGGVVFYFCLTILGISSLQNKKAGN